MAFGWSVPLSVIAPTLLVSSNVTVSKLKNVAVGPPVKLLVPFKSHALPPLPVHTSEAGGVPATTRFTNAGVLPCPAGWGVKLWRVVRIGGRPTRFSVGAGFAAIVAAPSMSA